MANFEAFHRVISSSINLSFLKSVYSLTCYYIQDPLASVGDNVGQFLQPPSDRTHEQIHADGGTLRLRQVYWLLCNFSNNDLG